MLRVFKQLYIEGRDLASAGQDGSKASSLASPANDTGEAGTGGVHALGTCVMHRWKQFLERDDSDCRQKNLLTRRNNLAGGVHLCLNGHV